MTSAIDLERKTENAFAALLKQQPILSRIRMRRTSEDSPLVNQDLILTARRGEGNPPFSGVYNLEVTASISLKHRRSIDTLTQFLALCAAMEEVFSSSAQQVGTGNEVTSLLAAKLSLAVPDFHCYEVMVTGKDDTPEDKKHKCAWSLSVVAMSQSYANAVALNP